MFLRLLAGAPPQLLLIDFSSSKVKLTAVPLLLFRTQWATVKVTRMMLNFILGKAVSALELLPLDLLCVNPSFTLKNLSCWPLAGRCQISHTLILNSSLCLHVSVCQISNGLLCPPLKKYIFLFSSVPRPRGQVPRRDVHSLRDAPSSQRRRAWSRPPPQIRSEFGTAASYQGFTGILDHKQLGSPETYASLCCRLNVDYRNCPFSPLISLSASLSFHGTKLLTH